ncbi:MAG: hypothetical protein UW51_C0006G0194 [Candidatus Amesbacteria bacterium GW2011_GWA1_44_24]|nr:MAG: hypothetical protein UW51_C0006G0194 [Candidatus Amesbacteria bacterium GW2011_GWA1_44_24]
MREIKRFIYRNAYPVIFILLVVLAIIFYFFSFHLQNMRDYLVNLSAGSISALLTVFLIDLLRERNKEIKWGQAKTIATEDIVELSTMLVSYMTIPFGYKVTDYKQDNKDLKKWGFSILKQILNDIQKKDISNLFRQLSYDKWEHLELNLLFIKPTLTDYIQTYSEILAPDLLGKMLKVRRTFNKFYYLFGLANIGFIKDKKPLDKVLLNGLAEDLNTYFDSVNELFTEVDKLNEK